MEGYKHKILASNEMVRIFPTGNVMYSSRLTLRVRCNLALRTFPFDSNRCAIRFASYAYTDNDISLQWKPENPIQVSDQLGIQGFYASKFDTSNETHTTTTGSYRALVLSFTIHRELGYYGLMVYIPCCMLVIASYITFWMKDRNTKYLISVAVLLLCAMSINHLNTDFPKTNYSKAIDTWTGTTLTFLFATYVLHVVLENKSKKDKDECLIEGKEDGSGEGEKTGGTDAENRRRSQCSKSSRLLARILVWYPVAFASFVILYFLVYWVPSLFG